VPRVRPNSVPEWMVTRSFSLRGVVMDDWPGRRRLSCGWMSSSVRGRLGGQLSMMHDTDLPCDSPALFTDKKPQSANGHNADSGREGAGVRRHPEVVPKRRHVVGERMDGGGTVLGELEERWL